jgi:hypothetical protein
MDFAQDREGFWEANVSKPLENVEKGEKMGFYRAGDEREIGG